MAQILIGSITLVLIVVFTVLTQITTACPMCGTGRTTRKICAMCHGLGKIPGTAIGPGKFARCHACDETGYINICAFCEGKGQISLLNWLSAKLAKKKIVRF